MESLYGDPLVSAGREDAEVDGLPMRECSSAAEPALDPPSPCSIEGPDFDVDDRIACRRHPYSDPPAPKHRGEDRDPIARSNPLDVLGREPVRSQISEYREVVIFDPTFSTPRVEEPTTDEAA